MVGSGPPAFLEELKGINPKTESRYRKYQHHRFLTPDTGHPHLGEQVVAVTTLMRVSDTKERFWDLFAFSED